jgi:hypothetical protein
MSFSEWLLRSPIFCWWLLMWQVEQTLPVIVASVVAGLDMG